MAYFRAEPLVFRLSQNLAFACHVHHAARLCFSESSATIIHLVSSRRISRRLSSRTFNPINSASFLWSADRTIRSIFSIAQYSAMSFWKWSSTGSPLKDPVATTDRTGTRTHVEHFTQLTGFSCRIWSPTSADIPATRTAIRQFEGSIPADTLGRLHRRADNACLRGEK